MKNGDISFLKVEGVEWCDIQIENNDIVLGNGLASAVYLILLTDARATLDEYLNVVKHSSFPYDLRGWWGDTFSDSPLGSKLWLNQRRKATDITLQNQIDWTKQALNKLIDSGWAKSVFVDAGWTARGVMAMRVEIQKPDSFDVGFSDEFSFIWSEALNYVQ